MDRIGNIFTQLQNVCAHRENERLETLEEHIQLSYKYLHKIKEAKNIDNILDNVYKALNLNQHQELLKQMSNDVIIFHDIGKINPLFQRNKLNIDIIYDEEYWKGYDSSNHSLLSSLIYFDYYWSNEIIQNNSLLKMFVLINAYVISRHHSTLNNLENYFYEINDKGRELYLDCYNTYVQQFYNMRLDKGYISKKITESNLNNYYKSGIENLSKEQNLIVYAYTRLLYSILVGCDYFATNEFINQFEMDIEENDLTDFNNLYQSGSLYKSIHKLTRDEYHNKADKSLNDLRSELFLEALENLEKNNHQHIYYLNAPTGSGKSNVAYGLSLKSALQEHKKIIYVYPYNSLIEQNFKSLNDIFDEKCMQQIAVYNSITPIKIKKKYVSNIYEENLLDFQFLNYPFLLMTHVSLFNILFSHNRNSALSFFQLVDSVIVLDEIQSYNISKWSKFIQLFDIFGKLFHMKFIIMSATLPPLDTLVDNPLEVCHLLSHKDYYFNQKVFSHRVEYHYNLLKDNIDLDILKENLHLHMNGQNILVEFIKKVEAKRFFSLMNDLHTEYKIMLLTGEDNSIERRRILDYVAIHPQNTLLIGTQVIEAGLDISMDIGFKDISIIDNEYQFSGRINRNAMSIGHVYFFNITNVKDIYRGDYRNNDCFTLEKLTSIKYLTQLDEYYTELCQFIKKRESHCLEEFSIKISLLANEDISNDMKLIKEDAMNKARVFFNYSLDYNEKLFQGDKIWNEYKDIMTSPMAFAKKKILLSQVMSKMNYFIYEIDERRISSYDDKIGDIYYIDNGHDYIKDGKLFFDEEKDSIGDFI